MPDRSGRYVAELIGCDKASGRISGRVHLDELIAGRAPGDCISLVIKCQK